MLLVPVRSDAKTLELPWVTTAIVLACTVVQLAASGRAVPEEEMARVLGAYSEAARAALKQGPKQTFSSQTEQWEVLRAMRAGEVEGVTAEAVERLQQAHAALKDARRRDLATRLSFTPADGFSPTLFTNSWAHGSWGHLIGNMLFLWIIGAHLEVLWGRRLFLALYLLGGLAGTVLYWRYHAGSETPCLGASGAIAATFAAFTVCYLEANSRFWYGFAFPGVGVKTGTFNFFPTFLMPMWIVEQYSMAAFEKLGWSNGVAYSAHVGGILAGGGLALALKLSRRAPMPMSFREAGELPHVPDENEKTVGAAETALLRGDAERAAEMADWVLARDPFHAGARAMRLSAALKLNDVEGVGRLASEQIGLLQVDGNRSGIVALYREVEAACPGAQLTAVALGVAFGACREADERLALAAGRQLVKLHPSFEQVPAVLLQIAELHQRAGRAEQARNALLHLVEKYPTHALAPKARLRLGHP